MVFRRSCDQKKSSNRSKYGYFRINHIYFFALFHQSYKRIPLVQENPETLLKDIVAAIENFLNRKVEAVKVSKIAINWFKKKNQLFATKSLLPVKILKILSFNVALLTFRESWKIPNNSPWVKAITWIRHMTSTIRKSCTIRLRIRATVNNRILPMRKT